MSDVKIAFGTASQAISCTLASLGTGNARECTAIDNTSNKFLDALLYLAIKLQSGTPASDRRINIWFYASEDGSNYTDPATGSDANITLRSAGNLYGPFVINTPDSGAVTYKALVPSVAEFFGGILPPKWGIVVENRTNIALDSTEGNHTKEYRGIYQTIA